MTVSQSSGFPILCYHSIDRSGSPVSVDPQNFSDQMAYLRRQGYEAVTLHDVVEYAQNGHISVKRPVCIVFDDGYKNNYTEAFPVLDKVGFSATIFVTTDYCGKSNSWSPQHMSIPTLPMMSWEEIVEMSRHGVEFGSHTKSHPKLAEIDAKMAREELEGAKEELENHLGKKVEFASYPFGSFNGEVKTLAESLFKAVVSTRLGKVQRGSNIYALERINAASKLFKLLPYQMTFSTNFDGYLMLKELINKGRTLLPK